MTETPLIIIGAGNSTGEIIDIINDINVVSNKKIKVIGILDDNKKLLNKKLNNAPIIGKPKDATKFKKEKFFLGIFSYKNRFARYRLIKSLMKLKSKFINIIHPSSLIGQKTKLGFGCLISNNCNIYSNSNVSNFCTLSPNVSLAPFSKVKDNCFIGNGSLVSSGATVEKSSYLGFRSSILENIKVSEGSRIMPNSIVTKNVTRKNSIIFGSPSKIIGFENKKILTGWLWLKKIKIIT